jgi:hypothetical protein
MDSSTYLEQVCIDSTKCPLILTSSNPASLRKPVIKYRDTFNVGPRSYAESKDLQKFTFDRNGALQILKTRNVIIDGIAIDGGGGFAYGYNNIWDNKSPLQFGNCAVSIYKSGGCIIRNCDISNAYIGINFKDRNTGGIFANANPSDVDTSEVIPMSRYGQMGNHLIEHNRIHNNSFGIFTESSWDLGSVFRYNLIYENHHPSEAFATTVKNSTSDGQYQPGGAFMFKDIQASPFAIYNNTFWHNCLIFCGHWQAGYQHLVFNNIFGPPYKYWISLSVGFQEMTIFLKNRISNSIYSAQSEKPSATGAYIISGSNALIVENAVPGALISGFPSSANNRWMEMDSSKFLSVDPSSPDFLEPKWTDPDVQNYIVQKGWQFSGVKNTDGTWADIGAIEKAHGTSTFVGTVNPFPSPVITTNGTEARISFVIDQRIGTIQNPAIKLFRLVKTKIKAGSFANSDSSIIVKADDITDLTVPAIPHVQTGQNEYVIPFAPVSDYAFIEMTIESTDQDGKPITMISFLPYRNLNYKLSIEFHDKNGSAPILNTVYVGDTVQLRLLPFNIDGTPFWSPLQKVSVALSSGFNLLVPGDQVVPLSYPNGLAGGPDTKLVCFTGIPVNGIEYISAGAEWKNPSGTPMPFIGGTSIKVRSRQIADIPKYTSTPIISNLLTNEMIITIFDLQGRKVFSRKLLTNSTSIPDPLDLWRMVQGIAAKIYLIDISSKNLKSNKLERSFRKAVVNNN